MFGIKTMDSKGQWPLAGLSYVRRKMQGKRDGGHGQHLSIHIFLCHSIYVKVFIHSGKRKCPYSLVNMLHESVIVSYLSDSVCIFPVPHRLSTSVSCFGLCSQLCQAVFSVALCVEMRSAVY